MVQIQRHRTEDFCDASILLFYFLHQAHFVNFIKICRDAKLHDRNVKGIRIVT